MYEAFGGVPTRTICDNLRNGVVKHPKEGKVILTDAYEMLGLAIIQASFRRIVTIPRIILLQIFNAILFRGTVVSGTLLWNYQNKLNSIMKRNVGIIQRNVGIPSTKYSPCFSLLGSDHHNSIM